MWLKSAIILAFLQVLVLGKHKKTSDTSKMGCKAHDHVILLHVGKTGGATVQQTFQPCLKSTIHYKTITEDDLRSGRRFIVTLRDPLDRFVSAYNWRHPDGGRGTHYQTKEERLKDECSQSCLEPKEARLYRCYSSINDLANGLLLNDSCGNFLRESYPPIYDPPYRDAGLSHMSLGLQFYFGPGTYFLDEFLNTINYTIINNESFNEDVQCAAEWMGIWGELEIKGKHEEYSRHGYEFTHINETGLEALAMLLKTEYAYYHLLKESAIKSEQACPNWSRRRREGAG